MKVMWFIKTQWWSDQICIHILLCESWSWCNSGVELAFLSVPSVLICSMFNCCSFIVGEKEHLIDLFWSFQSSPCMADESVRGKEFHTNKSVFITNKLHWINHHKLTILERSRKWKLWKAPANVNLMWVQLFVYSFKHKKLKNLNINK